MNISTNYPKKQLKDIIKVEAKKLGFCALGVAPVQLEQEFVQRLLDRPRPPYVPWQPLERCTAQGLEQALSVLVTAYPYHQRYPRRGPGADHGYFSPFARHQDYHDLVSQKLSELGSVLVDLNSEAKFTVQVDNGANCERLYAYRAGVGWQGKNNFIIVPGHGSFVWLGMLVTNLELPPDQPLENLCGDCDRCLRACPTQAYKGPNDFDHNNCMAFWAGEKALTPEKAEKLGRHKIIYGCDYCQLACPHNPPGKVEDGEWPLLEDLLNMDKAEFARTYKNTAAGWRGHSVLKRNAVLAAAGNPKLKERLQQLAQGEGLAADHARLVMEGFPKEDV